MKVNKNDSTGGGDVVNLGWKVTNSYLVVTVEEKNGFRFEDVMEEIL